jgi:hypothetical protein
MGNLVIELKTLVIGKVEIPPPRAAVPHEDRGIGTIPWDESYKSFRILVEWMGGG